MRTIFKLFGYLLLIGLAGLILFVGIKGPDLAQLTTQISAKWACQCRFIDGGTDEFCVAEDPTGFPGLDFYFEPAEESVSVTFASGWASTGTYVSGRGCVVE